MQNKIPLDHLVVNILFYFDKSQINHFYWKHSSDKWLHILCSFILFSLQTQCICKDSIPIGEPEISPFFPESIYVTNQCKPNGLSLGDMMCIKEIWQIHIRTAVCSSTALLPKGKIIKWCELLLFKMSNAPIRIKLWGSIFVNALSSQC